MGDGSKRKMSARTRLAITLLCLWMLFLIVSCLPQANSSSTQETLVSQSTNVPILDHVETRSLLQTQTAAPVATMYARLESTSQARSTAWALTPTYISTPTRTPVAYPLLMTEEVFNDYSLRIYRVSRTSSRFEILRNNECVYAEEDIGSFGIGSVSGESEATDHIAMGNDITGDGMPNLVIERCDESRAYYYDIFTIDEEFKHIATLHTWGVGKADFIDLDGNSSLEFVALDGVFVYWRTCFACSPRPKVILRYQDEGYRLAYDLMTQPRPATEELSAYAQALSEDLAKYYAQEILEGDDWTHRLPPPVELWSYMVELIYTGHSDLAWQFLNMAWPPEVSGKDEFLTEFLSQLSTSQYWDELQKWISSPNDLF